MKLIVRALVVVYLMVSDHFSDLESKYECNIGSVSTIRAEHCQALKQLCSYINLASNAGSEEVECLPMGSPLPQVPASLQLSL